MYAERTLESAKDKTEGEKLFASLDEKNLTRANRLEFWSKLHAMFPDGAMIGNFYVLNTGYRRRSVSRCRGLY